MDGLVPKQIVAPIIPDSREPAAETAEENDSFQRLAAQVEAEMQAQVEAIRLEGQVEGQPMFAKDFEDF